MEQTSFRINQHKHSSLRLLLSYLLARSKKMGPDFLKVPEMRLRGRVWEGWIQFVHLRPQWLCILLLKVAEESVRHPRRIGSAIGLHDF